jgi:hypothetical protein
MSICLHIIVADGKYGTHHFLHPLRDVGCGILVRLRRDRVLYRAPAPYTGRGRPSTAWEAVCLCRSADLGSARSDLSWYRFDMGPSGDPSMGAPARTRSQRYSLPGGAHPGAL